MSKNSRKLLSQIENQATQIARLRGENAALAEQMAKAVTAPPPPLAAPEIVVAPVAPTEAEVFAAKVIETQAEARRLHAMNPLLAAQYIMQNRGTYYGGR